MSRARNATRNIAAGLFSRAVSIVAPFAIRTIVIKTLGADYLGLNSLFVSILQVLSLAELGFGSAVTFSMYKPIAENNIPKINALYAFYKKVYRIIGTAMMVAGCAVTPILPRLIKGDYPSDINIYVVYFIYLLNTVISYWLFAYKDSLLQAYQRYDVSTNIAMISNCVMYALQILALLILRNYYAYIVLLPLSTVLNNLIKSWTVDRMFPQVICSGSIGKREKQELYKKIAGLILFKICGVCRNSFDSIVISTFLGLVILANYQNYFVILTALASIAGIVVDSIVSIVGSSIASESIEKNHRDFNTLFYIVNWLAMLCAVCLACLLQPFMTLWLGSEYLLSNMLAFLLGLYFYVQQIGNVGYVYRQAAGLWWENKLCPIVESVANLVLNVLLVSFLGVEGVVLATILTMFFINLPWAASVLFRVYFKRQPFAYWRKIFAATVGTVFMMAITHGVCSFVPWDGIVGLGARMVICLILPSLLMLCVTRRTEEYAGSKRLAIKMLKSVKR